MAVAGTPDSSELRTLELGLQRWVDAELISPEQAARIASADGLDPAPFVQSEPHRVGRRAGGPSLVVEALGYLGGVIIVVAGMLLAGLYWGQASTGLRLLLIGGAAAFLLLAGQLVPQTGGAAGRLGSVLWVASLVAAGGLLTLLANEAWDWTGENTALFVAGGVFVLAGLQWWRRHVLLQQVAFVATLVFVSVTLTVRLDGPDQLPGVSVWAVGLAWFLLGAGSVVTPARPVLVLSNGLTLLGSLTTMAADAGLVFALATAALVVGFALVAGDLIVLAIGAAGWLIALPAAVTTWLPGRLSAPLALLVVGVGLVGTAIRIARRKERQTTTPSRWPRYGDLAPGVVKRMAAGAALAATAVIVSLSL